MLQILFGKLHNLSNVTFLLRIYICVIPTTVFVSESKFSNPSVQDVETNAIVGVAAQRLRRLTFTRKVVGSIFSLGMEELGRSSCKPLPHPTQVQWVLGDR